MLPGGCKKKGGGKLKRKVIRTDEPVESDEKFV